MDVLDHFTTKEWQFTNRRIHALINKLDKRDEKLFFMDIRDVNWDSYFQNYVKGIRVYLIKDPLDTLPQARVKWQR